MGPTPPAILWFTLDGLSHAVRTEHLGATVCGIRELAGAVVTPWQPHRVCSRCLVMLASALLFECRW